MDIDALEMLEFDKIKAMLAGYTQSSLGRELVEGLLPMTQVAAVEASLRETSEARALMAGGAGVPLHGLADVRELVRRADRGAVLAPGDLLKVVDCLRGSRTLKRYMGGKRHVAPCLSRYAEAIVELQAIEERVYAGIDGGRVADTANDRLAKVRRELRVVEDRIQSKLQAYLSSSQYRDVLQESYISLKDGRHVLPVKASHRHRVDGLVIGASGSGMTVFVEPAAVRRLSNELQALRAEEEAEEYQVLLILSGLVAADAGAMLANLEILAQYDFALAKGKLSLAMEARAVAMRPDGAIQIVQGTHPLLRSPVPLNLTLGRRYRTLVITGPNTGGKTVALKTVGLLTLMAQAGLHVPAGEGTELAVFTEVLADIGDHQSIEQSLSTFSSHMGRIADILRRVNGDCLVLLDEVGTGTDPAEGAALAAASLEAIHAAGALTLATTHYSDLKRLADVHAGFINGCMEFDRDTLQPLFSMIVGEAGSSHALCIAERLGVGQDVLEAARRHLREGPHPPAPIPAAKAPEEPAACALPAHPPDPAQAAPEAGLPWQVGDVVRILTTGHRGVVAELADARGELVVFARGRRVKVNHKRLRLLVKAADAYPEGYDLGVALYTWPDRKLMRDMGRKHVAGRHRVITEGEDR